ncbi:MAG: tRNA uridine-5-carboxymethylaminomethyl(34) synthesis enzyme MnmG [Fibrobacterota bacterium]
MKHYDVIVVGGGHAGIEAASAAARKGVSVLLVTHKIKSVGHMPCNPAIGGLAKGIIVREIDALGGLMAKAADRAGIQFRMLNKSKGPAVWSPRAQMDRVKYTETMIGYLQEYKTLDIWEDHAIKIVSSNTGSWVVITKNRGEVEGGAVVITAGTYINGIMHKGKEKTDGGCLDYKSNENLSESLLSLGIKRGRLKTGTPARIKRSSVNTDSLQIQHGENPPPYFSFITKKDKAREQEPCFVTSTTIETKKIIEKNLSRSPLFDGTITGIGPRYCPSIETKIVRFPDKDTHQIFIEPEGWASENYYINGLSNSFPEEIQKEIVRSVTGMESAQISKYAYAIEYDFFYPEQLKFTLESKIAERLFLAGQVNGTSGYEEAAAQGLVAGTNAANSILREPPFIMTRAESYIGVLIDDIITKGVSEPYRMFTSRAEYRLLLRQDNADLRLLDKAVKQRLISKERAGSVKEKRKKVENLLESLKKTAISLKDSEKILITKGLSAPKEGKKIFDFLKRPQIRIFDIPSEILNNNCDEDILLIGEAETKYFGYINKQRTEAEKLKKEAEKIIPEAIDYDSVPGLLTEAREKLKKVRPESIGRASGISGVTPADISILLVYLAKLARER